MPIESLSSFKKLNGPYADLLKHSAIYAVGQLLSRLSSLLLLPVYTSYLRPADYGVIAILDLLAALLSILCGSGMAAAVGRYHFEAANDTDQPQVWWTGLSIIVLVATATLLPLWFFRDVMAVGLLGSVASREGASYLTLTLASCWMGAVGILPDSYLRVQKKSTLTVIINILCLLLNIGLNVYLLVAWKLGVLGILLGNFITAIIRTFSFLSLFFIYLRPYCFHKQLATALLKFGTPLVITGLLFLVPFQADRYFLRIFYGMAEVGTYSLACAVGQGIYSLCLLPFTSIWNVVVFEIAKKPDKKLVYVGVFQYFVYVVAFLMLGVSLFANFILELIASPEYLVAANLIPLICISYLILSLHEHFKVPVLLAKQTTRFLPISVVAMLTNVGLNILLIPRFGAVGAAWASIGSSATLSFGGLWRYRMVDQYPYPWGECSAVLIAMIASYGVFKICTAIENSPILTFGVASMIWLTWGVFLLKPFLWRRRERLGYGTQSRENVVKERSSEVSASSSGAN